MTLSDYLFYSAAVLYDSWTIHFAKISFNIAYEHRFNCVDSNYAKVCNVV